jgi:RhtB (resistance to homoserine/threonine) family protein
MSGYWLEFSQVAVAHLLAVASPGPDFAIVLKQSLVHGRSTARWTAAGVGTAILLHVGYSLLGLGLVVRSSPGWFAAVKYAGAAYIAWLGVQSLRAKPRTVAEAGEGEGAAVGGSETPTARGAFATGFLTNALNPKATLFFVSLFVMIVNPATPKLVQAGFGLWMALATAVWFALVATVVTRDDVRRKFLSYGHWIDRVLGVVFLGFAVSLVASTVG